MPITFALPLQAFRIYRNNNNNNSTEGEGCEKGGVNSAGTEKPLRGQRARESATFIVCKALFIILRAFHSVLLCTLFTLPPSAATPLCWYSSGCFVIYVALCRAWLARTFVNSKRPVSISWQASLYTVCPESTTLPPPPPVDIGLGYAVSLCFNAVVLAKSPFVCPHFAVYVRRKPCRGRGRRREIYASLSGFVDSLHAATLHILCHILHRKCNIYTESVGSRRGREGRRTVSA